MQYDSLHEIVNDISCLSHQLSNDFGAGFYDPVLGDVPLVFYVRHAVEKFLKPALRLSEDAPSPRHSKTLSAVMMYVDSLLERGIREGRNSSDDLARARAIRVRLKLGMGMAADSLPTKEVQGT